MKIKYILVLVILVLFVSFLGAQNAEESYNVIQINGNIFNITQSADLLQGKSFESQDELNFKQKAYAYVISDMRQKYMLRTPNIESSDADIFSNAALSLTPIRSRGQLSTRGAISETGVKDFKTYLGPDNFNVIGDELHIPMDSNVYPLSEHDFIVFYYNINGQKVSKKVAFDNQVLKIEKEKLKHSKGEVLNSDTIQSVSVYSYIPLTQESKLITEINLSFINPEELKSELYAIVPILKKQAVSDEEIKEYLLQYVIDIYGNMDDQQLKEFISSIAITAN